MTAARTATTSGTRTTMTDPSLLNQCPVVPVVVLDHPDQALPLGEALLAGGIDVVEITLRTAAGLESIRRLATLPGMHVGAGSVLVPIRSTRWWRPGPVRRQSRPVGRGGAAVPGAGGACAARRGHRERSDDRRRPRPRRGQVLPGRPPRRTRRHPRPRRTLHPHVFHALRRGERRQHGRLSRTRRRARCQRQLDGRPGAAAGQPLGGGHRPLIRRHRKSGRADNTEGSG